jgi:iron complex outermembrane receptor protein
MFRFRSLTSKKALVRQLVSVALLSTTIHAEEQQTAKSNPPPCETTTTRTNSDDNTKASLDCDNQSTQTLIITQRKTPFAGLEPTTKAVSVIEPASHVIQPSTLTELVEGLPGVAENSQPGLYQVISIRGVSRQRILTLVDGVRLSSERRAGVAASFIDPLLLGNVSITRGPISTYYGSGAIGGVTQLSIGQVDGLHASVGYQSIGNQHFQSVRWGDEENQFGLVNRKANNSFDINNNELNTHFHQYAGYAKKEWQFEDSLLESWLYVSQGDDIGRSNARFPNRIVNVPSEKHRIIKAAFTHKNKWSLDAYFHSQSTLTSTLRPLDSLSNVEASSDDLGINWQKAWEGESQSSLLGVDWYSRNRVNINENVIDLQDNQVNSSNTLRNGVQQELALFYTFHKKFNAFRFQAGGRYTIESATQTNTKTDRDNAVTGFVGLAYDFSPQFEVNLNAGNAFRFASLTERFFSGTTARGQVTGNPQLNDEKANNFDLGFQWKDDHQRVKFTHFISDFSNYIERVSISDDSLTFVNLSNGEIEGFEIEYLLHLGPRWTLNFSSTKIEGSNDNGLPLADIPSDRSHLALNYHSDNWDANLRLQHRATKTTPGNGELATRSANLLALNFSYYLSNNWQLKVYGDNLFDDEYVSSADDLATLAPGRHFGIQFTWEAH